MKKYFNFAFTSKNKASEEKDTSSDKETVEKSDDKQELSDKKTEKSDKKPEESDKKEDAEEKKEELPPAKPEQLKQEMDNVFSAEQKVKFEAMIEKYLSERKKETEDRKRRSKREPSNRGERR